MYFDSLNLADLALSNDEEVAHKVDEAIHAPRPNRPSVPLANFLFSVEDELAGVKGRKPKSPPPVRELLARWPTGLFDDPEAERAIVREMHRRPAQTKRRFGRTVEEMVRDVWKGKIDDVIAGLTRACPLPVEDEESVDDSDRYDRKLASLTDNDPNAYDCAGLRDVAEDVFA